MSSDDGRTSIITSLTHEAQQLKYATHYPIAPCPEFGYIARLVRQIKMHNKNEKLIKTFSGLVKAIDWYDVSLQAILEDLNLESVNRTQSMMLTHIARGVTRPCEIAKEMGTTRQNIHAVGKSLISRNILQQVPNPYDRRSKIYSFSDDGLLLRNKVLVILTYLDKKLSRKIGKDRMRGLDSALDEDWGDYVLTAPTELKN